jgi:hypothetical protein
MGVFLLGGGISGGSRRLLQAPFAGFGSSLRGVRVRGRVEFALQDALPTEGAMADFILKIGKACRDLCAHHRTAGAVKVDRMAPVASAASRAALRASSLVAKGIFSARMV